jgi:hypothetical protein
MQGNNLAPYANDSAHPIREMPRIVVSDPRLVMRNRQGLEVGCTEAMTVPATLEVEASSFQLQADVESDLSHVM